MGAMSRFRLLGALVLVWGVSCCLPGEASALPVGRQYEMVSPVFKGGFGAASINAVAPSGESVAYFSPGAFNGAPSGAELGEDYLATRSASGWSTVPLMPPASLIAKQEVKDMSPALDLEFATGRSGPNSEHPLLEKENLLLHSTSQPDVPSGWDIFSELESVDKKEPEAEVNYLQADADFCHILLLEKPGNGPFLPEADGTEEQLYEVDRGCDGGPKSTTLVGVNNRDKIVDRGCGVDLGVEAYAFGQNKFNAVSTDGTEVFFTDCSSSTGATEPGTPHQLFVRLGGSRTLEVSRPLEIGQPFGGCVGEAIPGEVPCEGAQTHASADFAGASEDGSKVYFTTTAPLAPLTDTDAGQDLYLATIGCSANSSACAAGEREVTSLTQVSHDPNGMPAEVQGAMRVAPDGRRVYFVAAGDLLSSAQRQILEAEGRPVPQAGAANLYAYDASSATTDFVGDLCSGKELSGTTEDIRCSSEEADTSLWTGSGEEGGQSQTGGADGGFLVFASYAQLTGDDTNTARDVYRYAAETGRLERVSVGENGYDANGTGGRRGASILQGHYGGSVTHQHEMNNRAISEDGSRIVFISSEPLSPAASNGLVNAYEWHASPVGGVGSVSLVSTGSDEEPVKDVVISPDGSGVFFVTVQGLVPQDGDGAPDIYAARLGGGFPSPPAERRPCEGDACQGPLTNPAPLLVPGSVAQAPGGNFIAPVSKRPVKAKKKTKAKKKAKKTKASKAGPRKQGKRSARFGGVERTRGRGER
jgi:hypothetical protein